MKTVTWRRVTVQGRRLAIAVAAAGVLLAQLPGGVGDVSASDRATRSQDIGFEAPGGESTQIKLKQQMRLHPPPPPQN